MAATDFTIRVNFEKNDVQLDELHKKIKTLNDELNRFKGHITKPTSVQAFANTSVALQSLNYTVRDSVYFFKDFQLGILAVGNNLNPLIDSMLRLKLEANGLNSSLSRILLRSLMGPQGVVFAFTILVSLLQAITFAMGKASKSTNDLSDEFKKINNDINQYRLGLEQLGEALDKIAEKEGIKKRLEEINNELSKMVITQEKLKEIRQAEMIVPPGETPIYIDYSRFYITKEQKEKLEKEKKELEEFLPESIKRNIESVQWFIELLRKGVPDAINQMGKSKEEIRSLGKLFQDIADVGFTTSGKLKQDLPGNLTVILNKIIEKTKATKEEFEKAAKTINEFLNPKQIKESDFNQSILETSSELQDEFEKEWKKWIDTIIKEQIEYQENRAEANIKLIEMIEEYRIKNIEDKTQATIERLKLMYKKAMDEIQIMIENYPELKKLGEQLLGKPGGGGLVTEEMSNLAQLRGMPQAGTTGLLQQTYMKELAEIYKQKQEENIRNLIKDVDKTNEQLELMRDIANEVGDTLAEAFMRGKVTLEQFLKSLAVLVLKFLVLKGLGALFNSGGVVGSVVKKKDAAGGIIKAAGGFIIGDNISFRDTIPALLTEGEMVLNYRQQQKLFNLFNDKINPTVQDKYNKAIVNRLDALNMNIANLETRINIYADTDALNFTRKKINYEQERLKKMNVKVV